MGKFCLFKFKANNRERRNANGKRTIHATTQGLQIYNIGNTSKIITPEEMLLIQHQTFWANKSFNFPYCWASCKWIQAIYERINKYRACEISCTRMVSRVTYLHVCQIKRQFSPQSDSEQGKSVGVRAVWIYLSHHQGHILLLVANIILLKKLIDYDQKWTSNTTWRILTV